MHPSSPPLPHPQAAPAAWFTGLAFVPVPLMVVLYGIDGLVLPCWYFTMEDLPFAVATAAIGGLFLAGAAHDRKEARRGLRVVAVVANLLSACAGFSLMFGL